MAMELGFLAEALAAGRSLWNMTIPDVVTAARPVLRRAGAIAKPEERDRRPTEKELEELASFYKFNFGAIPMRDLIPFAIDSAMRMGEIVALRWEDYRGGDKPMILIRDRKDPKIKKGNNQWVPLLGRTAAIIEGQDRQGSLIFPTRRTASARHSAVPVTACRLRTCISMTCATRGPLGYLNRATPSLRSQSSQATGIGSPSNATPSLPRLHCIAPSRT
ncbi:hypothetical protein SNK04_014138 [Fusarium graminearum]